MFFWQVAARSVSSPKNLQTIRSWFEFEMIWVDVESPLTISKCPRRIPNSPWIEFPSLHFLTCSCFYRRSLHHLKRCGTLNVGPKKRVRSGRSSDSRSILAEWIVATARSATKATNSTWNSRGGWPWFHVKWAGPGLLPPPLSQSFTSLPIIVLWFFCNSSWFFHVFRATQVKSE